MNRVINYRVLAILIVTLSSTIFGQFRTSSDWSTSGSDAQRSYWVRSDAKISTASLSSPDFQMVWTAKLSKAQLSAPILLDNYIGYRGFRTYAFVASSAGESFALDSDLGRVEWQKQGTGKSSCASAMDTILTRPVVSELPFNSIGRSHGGRGGPARSGVGEPFEGAVTLAQVAASRPPTPPPAAAVSATPARPPQGPKPTLLFASASDGTIHTEYVSNGEESDSAARLIATNLTIQDLSIVDGVAYATTASKCDSTADGISALDLTTKTSSHWDGAVTGAKAAFGPSALYVTSQDKLLSLAPKTLTVLNSYAPGQPFSASPLVFEYKTKVFIAATTKDGILHIIDSASPTNAAAKSIAADGAPYALASWQTVAETRRIIVAGAKSLTAWKIVDQNGGVALQKEWTVQDVHSPTAPLIINGVLFALEQGDPMHNSVLLAYDAATGKILWNSGTTISSFVDKSGGLAAGGGAIYFGTHDGTLWAFGFPIEH